MRLRLPISPEERKPLLDARREAKTLGESEAVAVGQYLASVVARAHARQLDPSESAGWLEAFRKKSAPHLKAPARLWASVVDLVALHEGAYLEHCREHALRATNTSSLAAGAVVSHVTGD
jgi:uncharacterized protein (DUF2252 family)